MTLAGAAQDEKISGFSDDEKARIRTYADAELNRFSTIRDTKETMAFSGLLVHLGAIAAVLVSKDWLLPYAKDANTARVAKRGGGAGYRPRVYGDLIRSPPQQLRPTVHERASSPS
jgi:hypothetical protein